MRTLLLLRHGKAAPEGAGGDRDRPLTARGVRAAERVAELLRSEHLVLGRVICSAALRARDTARCVAQSLAFEGAIHELDELYLAEPEAYLSALRRLGGAAECALLVGHNPSLQELALILTGQHLMLPPAGLVVCSLPVADFSEVRPGVTGEMMRFFAPREAET